VIEAAIQAAPSIRHIERMAGAFAKLLEIEELHAAIALAKGVDVIHVAHDFASGDSERLTRNAREIIRRDNAAMHIGHAAFDEASEHELAAALGDFHRADVSGPVVDILKKMAVDRS
jgi:hypothetical protein